MNIAWAWAMASKDTFTIPPIRAFVIHYLEQAKVSVDPFARNFGLATYTNDLDPRTKAKSHRDALEFLRGLRSDGVGADLVIFDPPYSPRQIKECYEGIGLKMGREDAWRTNGWSAEKNVINDILVPGGIFLQFGWNTAGMGKGRGYEMLELLVVCHGPGHNDTLCLAEKKLADILIQKEML